MVRSYVLPLSARLLIAFLEIALAVTVLSGSIVLGHELKDWRAWYYDPATEHPWAPTPKPTPILEVDSSL